MGWRPSPASSLTARKMCTVPSSAVRPYVIHAPFSEKPSAGRRSSTAEPRAA